MATKLHRQHGNHARRQSSAKAAADGIVARQTSNKAIRR